MFSKNLAPIRLADEVVSGDIIAVEQIQTVIGARVRNRRVNQISVHCTAVPSYKHFTGSNHRALYEGMLAAHRQRGWNTIGQHITIFPDGAIMYCRDWFLTPAVVENHNQGVIGIEVLGLFDKGKDDMTNQQRDAVIGTIGELLRGFKLNPENDVTYHCWYTDKKTCPGTAFIGGNTRDAYKQHVLPILINYLNS